MRDIRVLRSENLKECVFRSEQCFKNIKQIVKKLGNLSYRKVEVE